MENLHYKIMGCLAKTGGQQQTQQVKQQDQVVIKVSLEAKHKQNQKNLIKPANEPDCGYSVEAKVLNKSGHQGVIATLTVKQGRS